MTRGWLLAMLLTAMGAALVRADAPAMIHYQGRLIQGTNLYSGPVSLVFRLYNAPMGGVQLHYSTNFATAVDGLYATVIGQYGVVGNLDAALTNAQVWLELHVNGNILSPRERLLTVPYARAVHGMRVVHTNNIVLIAEAGMNTVAAGVNYSKIGGGGWNHIQPNVWYGAISGGGYNQIQTNSSAATISGGWSNRIQWSSPYATIGGGFFNEIRNYSDFTTIGGGSENQIQIYSSYSTVGGGSGNKIQMSVYSTIGGGDRNQIQWGASYSTIGGGHRNQIQTNSDAAMIGGGDLNLIGPDSPYAIIPGGYYNLVGSNARGACAMGSQAQAVHEGAFVWSDNSFFAPTVSTNSNSVTFRAAGGYRLFSNPVMTLGVRLDPNQTAWSSISDREAKENIEPLNTQKVLEGVKGLPLSSWEYKADPDDRRYIGPMAQDFQAAFGLGDDKTISTLDADGVLFAAVQALALENERIVREYERIARENEDLRRRIEELEKRIQGPTGGSH